MAEGRLHQVCLDLLHGSDIQFHRHSRLDIALVKNLPLALVFLPAADIPTFVGEGRVDLGITGRDQVEEHECAVPPTATTGVIEVLDLDFGKCALQVQVPQKGDLQKPEDLIGKNVVTSFTNLAEQYFRRLEAEQSGTTNGDAKDAKLKTNIKYVGGSVEAACALGVADGIVDLVESGETMRAAGLKAISTVVSSSAILIKSKHPSDPKLVDLITARIKGVISKSILTTPPILFHVYTYTTQPPKSTSSASTTSSARSSISRSRSHRVTARQPSLRSRRAAGSPSPLWCRGSRLLLLWTS